MRIRTFILASASALVFPLVAKALLIPLPATGYNQDIVVENTSGGANTDVSPFITATMDAGTLKTGGTWYQSGTPGTVGGLPAPLVPVVSTFDANTTFQFQPYNLNNALLLAGQNAASRTGSLTLVTPTPLSSLALFGATGNAGGATNQTNTIVVNFADATPAQTFAVTHLAQDWFNGTQAAFTAAGRFNNVVTGVLDNQGAGNPRVYQDTIDLSAFSTHPVSRVDITFNATGGGNNGGYNVVMAISGQVVPEPGTLSLVGFTAATLLIRRRDNQR